jgi:hypothetical protein
MSENKTEAGNGGKLGHSNMSHYVTTEELKAESRPRRRANDKKIVRKGVSEYEDRKRRNC